MDKHKTILVIGPARSGSSATTGALQRLGVNVGEELRVADEYNPLGFFEDLEMMKINSEITNSVGGDYWNPPHDSCIEHGFKMNSEKVHDAINKRNVNDVWGCKANMTLTYQYWVPLLRNPKLVITFRNPIDIAESVMRAKGMEFGRALHITNFYVNLMVELLEKNEIEKQYDITVVKFEELVSKPKVVVERLIDNIGLEVSEGQKEDAIKFIQKR